VAAILGSFRRNPAVKGLIFMPGATDEFYFFRRAARPVDQQRATLLDAVRADEPDPPPRHVAGAVSAVAHGGRPAGTHSAGGRPEDRRRDPAAQIRQQALYNDRDWDYLQHLLGFYLDMALVPSRVARLQSFLPQQFRGVRSNGWEALEATALAGNPIYSQEEQIVFEGDARVLGAPPAEGFSLPAPLRKWGGLRIADCGLRIAWKRVME